MNDFRAVCPACAGTVAAETRFCPACGYQVLTDIGVSAASSTQALDLGRPIQRSTKAPAFWFLGGLGLVVLVSLVGVGIGVFGPAESDRAPSPTSSPIAEDSPLPASVSTEVDAATPSPHATGDLPTHPGLGTGTNEVLALIGDEQIVLIDVRTGERADVDLATRAPTRSLASAGNHLVFIHSATAFMQVSNGDDLIDLGPADTALDAATESSVWLGLRSDGAGDRMSWREVDAAGTVLRTTVTELPMDFALPDLRWGHQHRMLRLTRDDSRPWRVVAQGFPIAAGPNDLILSSCDRELTCDRRWFDLRSGADRGPLLADIADHIGGDARGQLSPNGRYWLGVGDSDRSVTVLALATGEEIANECTDLKNTRWSRDDVLLACQAENDVLVYDITSNAVFRVELDGTTEHSFTFVPR